jgi:Zn ribbon nucleic-acid-binding protein
MKAEIHAMLYGALIIVLILSNLYWYKKPAEQMVAVDTKIAAELESCTKTGMDCVGTLENCMTKLMLAWEERDYYMNATCPDCPDCVDIEMEECIESVECVPCEEEEGTVIRGDKITL